jgi:hypothetical protein
MRLGFSLAVLVATGALLAPALADDASPKPCTAQEFHFEQVAEACANGGRKAARELMKAAVKKAKAEGESVSCGSCHVSLKTYELEPGAAEQLERWL